MLSFLNQELNVQLRECPWEHYQDVLKVFFYDLYCFRLSYLVAVFWKGMVGTLRSCLHFNYVHLFLELIELHHLASVGWGCVFDLIYQCTVSFLFFLKKGLFNVFSVIGIECWLKWISFKGCFIFSAYILKNLHLIVKLLYIKTGYIINNNIKSCNYPFNFCYAHFSLSLDVFLLWGNHNFGRYIYFGGKVVYFSYQPYIRCFAQSSAFSSFSVV